MRSLLNISVFFLLAFQPQMKADGILKTFSQRLSSSRLSFSYEFSTKGDLPLKGKGTALIQGRNFIIKGEGLEVRCDGLTRWTMDPVAKEAVAESVESSERDYMTDPALLLSSVEDVFSESSSGKVKFQGKEVDMFILKPKLAAGLNSVKLYFDAGLPVFAEVTVKDGTVTVFTLKDMKFLEKADDSLFFFNEASLDSSWIITDLR